MSGIPAAGIMGRAVRHHQAGQLDQAEALYRQVLASHPHHGDALDLLGVVQMQRGRRQEALALVRQAIKVEPRAALYHSHLGMILMEDGNLEEAVEAFRRTVELDPRDAEHHDNLGSALARMGKFEEARKALERALALQPNLAAAHSNLGNVKRECGDLEGAATSLQNSIRLAPRDPAPRSNLGLTFLKLGRVDESLAAFQSALALQPAFAEALSNLAAALRECGRLDESVEAYRRALQLRPGDATAHSALIITMHYHPSSTAETYLREVRDWAQRHAAPFKGLIQPHTNDRNPDRRLRIGYVSSDFRRHASAFFLMPLLAGHDRAQYETCCYADVARPDGNTEVMQKHSGLWRFINGLSDRQVAEMIRQDRIDILVDLKLHTEGNRLRVFAQKPAPVQVSWLGYPGTTGLETIDYRITDPYLDPPGEHDSDYAEQSIRLPASFWCYDQLGEEPLAGTVRTPSAGAVTFGCLNTFCKVNDGVLRLWIKVLSALPGSRLMLLAPEGQCRLHVLEVLRSGGVEAGRVEFVARVSRGEYLKLYQRMDIALDTVPCNGHTTSLDALWMSVPVVTLVGPTVMGRAGLSQLMNLGLPELIARTEEEYLSIAIGLANDPAKLAALRASLRPRMLASPLMDGSAFARAMEAAYRQMWRRWCEQPAK